MSCQPCLGAVIMPEPVRSSMILHSPNGNFAIRRGPLEVHRRKAKSHAEEGFSAR